MTLRWGFGIGLLLAAFAATGCDVEACTNRDANGECQFDGFDRDSGPGIDASADAGSSDGAVQSDGSTLSDGAVTDAGPLTGIDGGVPDSGTVVLEKSAFCAAQYRTATAWQNLIESLACPCDNDDRTGGADFLEFALAFTGIAPCEASLTQHSNKIAYDRTKAGACAARLDAQFASPAPPAMCPETGFDISVLESMIGHGAQFPVQIPECRAAFVGSIARDAACVEHLECVSGLRCLGIPGGGKSCQPARSTNESCGTNSECADGHVCAGSAASGRTCIRTSQLELRPQGGNCTYSLECINDLVCDPVSFKCVQPVADVICKP